MKSRTTHPVLTNVGLINSDSLDFGEIKAKDSYLITPIVYAPGFIMGIITFKETMTLSIGFCEGSYEKAMIEEFLGFFDKELPS
ncbi:MAG: hypothetical protein GF308_18290 [Candidatus Heimdallarchaeota archaeon]|nr:hypothetical protein [Candidatus Heimdallarchaeota archaeon]